MLNLVGLFFIPILVVAIILILIGLFTNAIALSFLDHLHVLKLIKLEVPYIPYNSVLMTIALQIAIGAVSAIIVVSSGRWILSRHLPANLLSDIVIFAIYI